MAFQARLKEEKEKMQKHCPRGKKGMWNVYKMFQ
jgi:hypothetical protein